MIKACYIPQGLVIGDAFIDAENVVTITNPALIIARQNEVALAPLLHLVEETTIKLNLKDIAFGCLFTPKRELINHYNQIYGSGIVLTTSLPNT